MDNRLITIPYKEKSVEACVNIPDVTKNTGYGVILTHGAGGDMHFLQLTLLAEFLSSRGVMVVRFTCKGLNLAYRVKVYLHVVEYVIAHYKDTNRYFVAGRSMGARAAIGVANNVKGTTLDRTVAGVIALSYPLHTQGNKSALRDGPLYELNKPVCFIGGTEDEMCEQSLFENVLRNVDRYEVKWIQGANHALKVKGSNEEDVIADVGNFIFDWCNIKCSDNDDIANSENGKETKQIAKNSKRKSEGKNEISRKRTKTKHK
ncbi:testis-expressed protein 30-like [Mercenaria mercenaria]|uniref:testis-expressed protein 30-like n=1 Tax=Mercenaria mercenaria TaxID=6596 RepID=UPI00234FB127|nr:testis-expressed protein 30-like [Mercenaria mercenaria]